MRIVWETLKVVASVAAERISEMVGPSPARRRRHSPIRGLAEHFKLVLDDRGETAEGYVDNIYVILSWALHFLPGNMKDARRQGAPLYRIVVEKRGQRRAQLYEDLPDVHELRATIHELDDELTEDIKAQQAQEAAAFIVH